MKNITSVIILCLMMITGTATADELVWIKKDPANPPDQIKIFRIDTTSKTSIEKAQNKINLWLASLGSSEKFIVEPLPLRINNHVMIITFYYGKNPFYTEKK